MAKALRIKPGIQPNRVTIIKVINGLTVQTTDYEIMRPCCGKTEIVSHKALTAMIRKTTNLCRSCSHKVTSELRKGKKKTASTKWGGRGQVYIPGWGLTLGSFRIYNRELK